MTEVSDEYWSLDEEHFSYESLGELFDCNDDLEAGDMVYVGRGEIPDPAKWVDADDVIEQLACRAGDDCGEFAEDYPNVSKEAKAELEELLKAWSRKHCTPSWYMIEDVRHYEITSEDIAEAHGASNTSVGATTVSLGTPLDKDPPGAADIASESGRAEGVASNTNETELSE